MAFRIKDLIIDLWGGGKGQGLCGPATKPDDGLCGPATKPGDGLCGPATKITPVAALCGPATKFVDLVGLCGPATKPGDLVAVATAAAAALGAPGTRENDLAVLKRQLQEALACIEQAEHRMPETRAEADDLEEKLKAALAELAEHKKGLKP